MKLSNTDEKTLIALGLQTSQMLSLREYSRLASQFGYALCHGRSPAEAIESDYERAIASPYETRDQKTVSVKYFKPNSTGLYAAIECLVPVTSSTGVLLSLIVAGSDDKHLTIEDISGVTN